MGRPVSLAGRRRNLPNRIGSVVMSRAVKICSLLVKGIPQRGRHALLRTSTGAQSLEQQLPCALEIWN